MERRKRNLLVVLIGIVIVVAMVSSFGLGLFAPDTAKIVLPTPEVSQQPGGEPGEQSGLVLVDVTPETVQSVIRDTLSRPDRYTRAVTIEDFWGEGESGTTHADVWVDGGWTQTEAALPGGTVRYSIVGDGQFWLWYGGDRTALSGPADGHSADLEGQRIPTYEDVLELEQDAIAAAGYEEKGGLACIYVETGEDALGYVEKYWVSVDSGLLVCAEQWKGEELTYRMTSYAVSKDGKISRGGDFVSSTINGYDQSVQNFASGKALFLQQGNWAYNDLVSANADLADSLTFVPLKFPYQEGDVTAEGKTVEQLNSSIPVFAPCYYSINTQVSKEEQKLAEEFLVWMNTSETGRDFIENKFSFIPYDAGEDAVASNSLNASILEYKAEGNVLSNPYTGAPPTWASKVMGNMMLEEYLCREGSWTQEDYQHIAQEAVKGWKNLMDLY